MTVETSALTLIRTKMQWPQLPGDWVPGDSCWTGFVPTWIMSQRPVSNQTKNKEGMKQ